MLKPLFLAAALASAAVFTGCASMQAPSPQMTENLQQLQNRAWIATQIGNTEIKAPPAAHSLPSIQFDEASKRVSGSDSCNRIMGAYTAGHDTLQLSQMASTLGELSETDAAVVAQLLAKPATRGVSHNV